MRMWRSQSCHSTKRGSGSCSSDPDVSRTAVALRSLYSLRMELLQQHLYPPQPPPGSCSQTTAAPCIQALRELAAKQAELEEVCTTAFAKSLYMVFGVELDREAAADAWGGMASAKVARSQLDSSTALDIFSFVGYEIQEVLDAVTPCRSKLLRHKSILEQLLKAFPHPPDEVRHSPVPPPHAAQVTSAFCLLARDQGMRREPPAATVPGGSTIQAWCGRVK